MTLHFAPSGRAVMVYSDAARNVVEKLGAAHVRRASTVEPDHNGDWLADLSPVLGPQLPACRNRADALAAEVTWLNAHLGELS